MRRLLFLAVALHMIASPVAAQQAPPWLPESMRTLSAELVARHGEAQRPRLTRGMTQVARLWRSEDGDAAAFEGFVRTHFAGDSAALEPLFQRMQFVLESTYGHLHEIGRDLRWQAELDLGPILPFDEILAGYDPYAHFSDDWFANKLAFVVLLNFPLTTLEERLAQGPGWSRRQWAETKLAQQFSRRVPAAVSLSVGQAVADASQYVATYNIWAHHLVDDGGERLFPADLRLLEHWNLRDQIKADYQLPPAEGLPRQRMIQRVMERIVDQSIPQVVIDNPHVDWNPVTNQVRAATVLDPTAGQGRPAPAAVTSAPEPDTRYARILAGFRAVRQIDPYSPAAPTHIARSFDEDRQLPEPRVRRMLEEVLGSPLVPRVAALIRARLGRPLEPFDIWYSGFRPGSAYSAAQLDGITRRRFPSADAYRREMPALLEALGFGPERARYLAANIEVDPARGSGHAMPSLRRGDNPRLRTRIGPEGMDYKGYNIAVHEMGHNVEQVFSLKEMDYWTLSGVPNTAFTEALAFVFQSRDLELLGLAPPSDEARAVQHLNDFWNTYEIAGVGLVDLEMWRWMYDHPGATPAELRSAVVAISRDVWNRWYAPVFGRRDETLLGVYAHMVGNLLYLPDYSLGHIIAHQIEEQVEGAGELGAEIERMARIGAVTPDLWMTRATGAPVGPGALFAATERALAVVRD